ncbi:hypothetical protein O6H91_02G156400 [Diphasiastrum complanatum]|uniref:Uncharacterized protein n=1 Tax=Diphasiastrum complanatum TaxID=34168 RepID=A0ACC2EM71_DIPCM|nr:hypothetical protein O6H91_02G156400 [Diphasiastrum complanatum]
MQVFGVRYVILGNTHIMIVHIIKYHMWSIICLVRYYICTKMKEMSLVRLCKAIHIQTPNLHLRDLFLCSVASGTLTKSCLCNTKSTTKASARTCFTCKAVEHYSPKCLQPRRQVTYTPLRENCSRKGHINIVCPKPLKAKIPFNLVQTQQHQWRKKQQI